MHWKTGIDDEIYELLNNNKKLHFNEILKNVYPYQKERKNQETLRCHLNRMVDQGILKRDNPSLGKKRYYWLSEKTEFEKKFGIFTGINPTINIKTDSWYKKRAILMVLFSLGDTIMYRRREKKYYEKETGYSLDDNVEYLDYRISRISTLNSNYYDIKNIDKYFIYLKKMIPEIILTMSNNNVPRFKINDKYLNNFLWFSLFILKHTIEYVEERFFVLNKIEKGHYKWLMLVRGAEYTKQTFEICRNKNMPSTIKERYIQYHEFEKFIPNNKELMEKILRLNGERTGHIEYLSNGKKFDKYLKEILIVFIQTFVENLKIGTNIKYEDIKTKYKNIYNIVVELVYPQFLRNIYKINFFEDL